MNKVRFTFLSGRGDNVGPQALPSPKAGGQGSGCRTCYRTGINDWPLSLNKLSQGGEWVVK